MLLIHRCFALPFRHNKQLLDEVFAKSKILEVEVRGIRVMNQTINYLLLFFYYFVSLYFSCDDNKNQNSLRASRFVTSLCINFIGYVGN